MNGMKAAIYDIIGRVEQNAEMKGIQIERRIIYRTRRYRVEI